MPSRPDGAGTLFVCATPLGNLQDITLRLGAVLAQVQIVYAEDTRRTRALMAHLGLSRPIQSLHAHNEMRRCQAVMDRLAAGDDVGLLTDAGTPAVSDPGAAAVNAAHCAGYRVSPVAGPSALAAALSVAGFDAPTTRVLFMAFLARMGRDRADGLAQVAAHGGVVVFFEAANRLAGTLTELARTQANREVCICREMTKMHEEVRRAAVAELAAWAASATLRGEVTVVLGPYGAPKAASGHDAVAISAAVARCLAQGMTPRAAAVAVAAVLGVPRKLAYASSLQLVGARGAAAAG